MSYAIDFGNFRLLPQRRQLLENDAPVRVPGRAMEILVLLAERAGEVIAKEELIARAWPNIFVDEGSLRVQINALRKALRDGRGGTQFITNVTGRGYSLVAAVRRSDAVTGPPSTASQRSSRLPARVTRIIGREKTIATISSLVEQNRLVTVVGAGGVGKTTVATAAASALLPRFEHGARFVDLATLTDSRLVPNVVAAALDLAILSRNPMSGLLAFLRDKQFLIVLDNCEHVIAAAAELSEAILRGAPRVKILVTSREPLRAEGERTHRLSPFSLPSPSQKLSAAEAAESPAIELFAERAAANLDSFRLSDQDAPIVVDICRRLDGIPLAIELVVPAVGYLGLRELASRLNDHFQLSARGYRTSLPRQQTLRATLDWSFATLSKGEQTILSRIAVFRGIFTRKCAVAVATSPNISSEQVLVGLNGLVAKSLVTAEHVNETVVYRLLDSTRAYAAEALRDAGEYADTIRRHADRCRGLLIEAAEDWQTLSLRWWRSTYGPRIDDVRASIDWAFSPAGDVPLGIELTVLSIPLALQLSLLAEYRQRAQYALGMMQEKGYQNDVFEMELYIALGSLIFTTQGPVPESGDFFSKALAMAPRFADKARHREAFGGMWIWTYGSGDYPDAVDFAHKIIASIEDSDKASALVAERLMALSLFFRGELTTSRQLGERALADQTKNVRLPYHSTLQQDRQVTMRLLLARLQWLHGFPNRAARTARESLEIAKSIQHSTSICSTLAFGSCLIAIWNGDWAEARQLNAVLLEHSTEHSLGFWRLWGQAYELILSAQERGELFDPEKAWWQDMPVLSAKQSDTIGTISECLADPKTIERTETGQVGWCAPEILRAKGEMALKRNVPNAWEVAEDLFGRSLDLARRQGALAWQLRTSISLARLWRDRGRAGEAHGLLIGVYDNFTEGFETQDLLKARALLEELAARLT